MNQKLLHTDVQDFLRAHAREKPAELALKKSPFEGVSPRELAEQLDGRQRAEKKMPSWYASASVIYPSKLAMEQASSEVCAAHKSLQISGNRLLDLSGGMGVDTFYFSKRFEEVVHCEIYRETAENAERNLRALGASNIEFYQGDGLARLRGDAPNQCNGKTESYDWIYLDPSRRAEGKQRVFRLADCIPNVPEHLDLLMSAKKGVMLKLSPFLDIDQALSELEHVKSVEVVAWQNEVKELLFILEKNHTGPIEIKSTELQKRNQPKTSVQPMHQHTGQWKAQTRIEYASALNYLYAPNSALIKAQLMDKVSSELGIYKIHPNSHLYTSNELIDYPGRRFEITGQAPYKIKALKRQLKGRQAHVATRNFPDKVELIRKKIGLKDGGSLYLFFTTNLEDKPQVLFCRKI